jgi:DNA modification methylase
MALLFEELVKKNNSPLLNIKSKITLDIPKLDLRTEVLQIFNNLAEDKSWVFENISRKDTSYASHGYHRYPAKFIPQLARRCIEEYTKKEDIVCDPFMGCGTTLVEALVSGRKAVGVDINPVAWLITKAKSTPIEPTKLENEVNKLLGDLELYITSKNKRQKTLSNIEINPIIPNNERINYWFPHEDIREELGIVLGRINQIKNKEIRTFCLCAFSQILKNSSIWLMKSIKPTRDLKKKPTRPLPAFKRHIKQMLRGNEELYNTIPETIKNNLDKFLIAKKEDARRLPCDDDSVSLIVTSPPYVTSYEYADLHQLTALWLGYAKDVTEFREGFIGSIHKKESVHDGIKSKLAKQEIEELSKKSKREAEAVRDYFFEMQQCFEEMYRVLKPNGKACIVIGDTELKKVPILNAEVFVEIMLNLGFRIHKIVKRRIPSKILPQTRDSKTGRFTSNHKADRLAYAYEYIIMMEKI